VIAGRVVPTFAYVALGMIDEPALPSRSSMDEQKMDELVESMRQVGFTSVMLLVRVGDRFEVIAGHRRWHAAHRAGIAAIPALLYPEKFPGIESLQFGENEFREDLSAADEAIWCAQLLEQYPDEGTDGVAARLHVKRDRVERRLALFGGDELVFEALKDGKIGVGVAELINRCSQQEFRRMFLDNAIRHGATVGIVSGWLAEWQRDLEPATRSVFAGSASTAAAAPKIDPFFTCAVCRSTHQPEQMRPLNVHGYCIDAILTPALEFWQRRADYITKPRTQADAVDLINQLIDDWPGITAEDSSAA
jgi:ParB family transcriptional regulator, chromosome partitioning protein